MIHTDKIEQACFDLGVRITDDSFVELPADLTKLEQLCHEIAHAVQLGIPIREGDVALTDAIVIHLNQYSVYVQNMHEVTALRATHKTFEFINSQPLSIAPFEKAATKRTLGLAWGRVPNKVVIAVSNSIVRVLHRLEIWP